MKSVAKYLVTFALGVGAALGATFLLSRLGAEDVVEPATSPSERLSHLDSFGRTQQEVPEAETVAALGRIEPGGGLVEISGQVGDRVAEVEVKEGEPVEKDAILATMASHAEIEAERDAIAAQLEEAKARLAAETAYAQALVRQAQIAKTEAERIAPLEIKVAESQVRLAQTGLETAQDSLDRLEQIGDPELVSEQELEHQRALVRQAEEQVASAESARDQAKGACEMRVSTADAQLEAAKARLAQVQSTVPVKSLEKQLAAADVRLARSVLRAPIAGRIFQIQTQPGEQIGRLPVLVMADTTEMVVVAEVYETDIGRVRAKENAKATITSPALPKPLTGKVERIGLMIERNDVLHVDPAADTDTRVVETYIKLDDPEAARGLTNLQVDVVIDLDDESAASGK